MSKVNSEVADEEEIVDEDPQEESADDSSSDEDDTESEEQDDDEEEYVQVKVFREGDKLAKILDLTRGITLKQFCKMVVKKCGLSEKKNTSCGSTLYPAMSELLFSYEERGSNDHIEITDKRDYARVMDEYWLSTDPNYVLKVFVSRRATPSLVVSNTTDSHQPQEAGRNCAMNNFNKDRAGSSNFDVSLLAKHSSNSSIIVQPGQELKWTKLNLLGKGSFGVVYEGITNAGNLIAVKQLELSADKVLNNDDAELKNLMSEIALLSSLQHKNIVAYYGSQIKNTDNGGKLFEIFLEHCHGGSLTSLRKKFNRTTGRLSIILARNYTRQILEGLLYLHSMGVMHRDIKSDNVLVSATGEAKLADFGCSKKMGTGTSLDNDEHLYQSLVGTPLFMAPEVMNDALGGYNRPADIWSVGCLLIDLLGRKPWNLSSCNLFQVMFHISQSKELPSGIPNDCQPTLQNFFENCFDRDPKRRATAGELLRHQWIVCPEDDLEEISDEPSVS